MEERREDSVCKKDFKRLEGKVDRQGESITKLMEIYPILKDSAELKKSVNVVVRRSLGATKVVAVFLGVIATIVGIIIGIKQLLK